MRDEPATTHVDRREDDDTSLLCVSCGYDLRGLDPAGTCPECGTPIARSRQGDRLAAADPRWLARMARGQRWLANAMRIALLSLVAYLVGTAIIVLAYAYESIRGRVTWVDLDRVVGVAWFVGTFGLLVIVTLSAIVGAIGLFLVTMQDPREQQREPLLSARRVARCSATGFVAACAVAATLRSIAWFGGPALTLLHVLTILTIGLTLTGALVGLMRWLSSLARRAPAPKLASETARRAKYWSWMIPIIAVWLAACASQPLGLNIPAPLDSIVEVIFNLFGCAVMILILASIVEAINVVHLMQEYRRMLGEMAEKGGALAAHDQRGPAPGGDGGGGSGGSSPTSSCRSLGGS